MNVQKCLFLGVSLVAALHAFGWGAGHDTVARALVPTLPAAEQDYLKDAANLKRYLAWSHLPDSGPSGSWTNVLTEADRAVFLSHGAKDIYSMHKRAGYWSAFVRLVAALRAQDTERILLWKMALGHSIADMAACNHDPLIHIAEYGWGSQGAKVLTGLQLDLGWVESRPETKASFYARAAQVAVKPADPKATLADALLEISDYESEGMQPFADQVKLLQAASDFARDRSETHALALERYLGDLGLWAVARTRHVFQVAELIASRGDALDFDVSKLEAEVARRWDAFTRTRPMAGDGMVAPFLPDGRPSKVRVVYDPVGRFGSGPTTWLDRFLSVNVLGSLRACRPDLHATALDIRELHDRGVDPAATPVLVVFGTQFNDWGYLRAKQVRAQLVKYAQAGGKLVWIGGGLPPGVDDAVRGAQRATERKDGYCQPAFPLPFDKYAASSIAWTGSPDCKAWSYVRPPVGKAGWHWRGSREYFKDLPESVSSVLEIVPSGMPHVVYGVASPKTAPRLVFLPTAVFHPFLLTDEKPRLEPVCLRLDSAGEHVLRETMKLLVRPYMFTVDAAGVVGVNRDGQVFRAATDVPATVKAASGDRVEMELKTPDGLVTAVWAKAADGAPELVLSAPTGRTMKASFAYPARWETEAGDDVVLPFGEGMSYPVDDPQVVFQQARAPFSNGMSASMGFFGVLRKGVYFMTGVERTLDAGLNCRTNIPYAAGVYWRPSNGTWGYDRRLRMFAGNSLGAVASGYRAWRERQGRVRTLAEKAKLNPHLADFPGTADFWIWDDNNQNRLYNWPRTEPPAGLDVRRIAREMKELGMDRVLWNAFEGLSPEDCAFLTEQGYLTGTYDCLRDVFHPGLVEVTNPSNFVRAARFLPFADAVTRVNPDGSLANAWTIPDKTGKMHPMHALCDALSLDMCRKLIAPEVARIGYTSRLMDVQAGGGPAVCYSKVHPCTGAEALEALRAEHRYLGDDLDLVVGVEVGSELMVDAYHYAEGLPSLPHVFRKELCWRYKDQALYGDEIPPRTRTIMHNPKYRIPLWELVYHDCAVNYYYWADTSFMYPQLTPLKDAYCRLYGLPPIYSMNVSTWNRHKHEVAESYRRATGTARKTMFSRMTGFEYVTADRLVQRTTFANGVTVTEDFRDLHANCVAQAPGGFKILSFNICHGKGMDGQVDLARAAAVVNRERPRFAALQELDCRTRRVKGVDQPAELGRMTGMVPTFARAIDYQGGEYGVMLLSRKAPRAVRKLPLPGKEPRILLLAEFDDCWVGCTHLSVARKEDREASVRLIEAAVKDLGKPVFLTGDWNSLPDSSVLMGLDGFLQVVSDTQARTFHGRPANGPSGTTTDFCIDYVAVDDAHAASYRVLGRGTVEDRNTSDHAPIWVTVEPVPSRPSSR